MKVTTEQIKNILKTLPIGYYLGHDIPVKANDSVATSYFDPKKFEIIISTRIILQGLANCNDEKNIETIIRSMLYHEISHVILTPTMIPSFPAWFNVFEDERIETVLKDLYMNVDFKWTVKTICKDAYLNEPKTFDEYWFRLCRFRLGKPDHVAKVEAELKKFENLSSSSDYRTSNLYYNHVYRLYNLIKDEFEQDKQQQQPNQPSQNGSSAAQNDETSDCQNKAQPSETQIDDEDGQQQQQSSSVEKSESVKSKIKQVVSKLIEWSFDNAQYEELDQIIHEINKKKGRYGGNIQAYSGIFNYRQVTRKDCKFFTQTNRQERSSVISKVKLNLFIDGSSSYEDNVMETNKIIRSLEKLEKTNDDFEFDVISIFYDNPFLRNKKDRIHSTMGCSFLGTKAKDVYKKVQDKQARTINILLLDGEFDDIDTSNFDIFNQRNCIIISDSQNEEALKKRCGLASKTFVPYYTRDYSKRLFKSIAEALRKQVSSL